MGPFLLKAKSECEVVEKVSSKIAGVDRILEIVVCRTSEHISHSSIYVISKITLIEKNSIADVQHNEYEMGISEEVFFIRSKKIQYGDIF